MATERYSIVGTYLIIPNIDIQIKRFLQTCTNEDCDKPKERIPEGFCSKCGTRIGILETIESKKVSAGNLENYVEIIEGEIPPVDAIDTFWHIRNEKCSYLFSKELSQKLDVNSVVSIQKKESEREREVEKFRNKYKLEMKKLQDFYKGYDVEVAGGYGVGFYEY